MRELVELGLKRSGTSLLRSDSDLPAAVDRLLATLSTLAGSVLEAEPEVISTFVTRIDVCRRALNDVESGRNPVDALDTAIRSVEHFVKSSRRYIAAREAELTEMIRILHEAARLMAGRSSSFNEQVMASSEKLNSFVQLDDIRQLKRQLADEVNLLRAAVEEKQRRDAEASATLTQRLKVLQRQLDKVEEEASLDPLTKIANRGAFDRALASMIRYAREHHTALSMAMFDIDHFKRINDTHGHPVGDRVLLCAAQWLAKGLRSSDFIARYGGEEFAVLFPNARSAEIEKRVCQVIAEIAGRSFEYEAADGKRAVQFTVSAGVTELTGNDTAEDLVKRADEALYDAKRNGRNRVVARKRSFLSGLLSRT